MLDVLNCTVNCRLQANLIYIHGCAIDFPLSSPLAAVSVLHFKKPDAFRTRRG